MCNAATLCGQLRHVLPNVKNGTFRIWGEWFGKPYDNWLTLKRCDAHEDALLLYFDQGEKLSIWSPAGLLADKSAFRINDAVRVRLEWFAYGRPRLPSNLYFEDFVKAQGRIRVTTNIDWYNPKFNPKTSEPAVEIL